MKIRLQMFNITIAIAVLAFGSAAIAQSDDSTEMPEAIKILKKYSDVTGGVSNYKKIKAMKMSGTINVAAAGMKGKIEVLQAAPDKIFTKAEIDQFGSQVQGTNGDVGWDISTTMGPRLLEKNELDRLKEQANLARIYDPEQFYKEMKTVGVEELKGEDCYKLKLTKKNGDESVEFYSVKTGLQVCAISTIESQMGAMEIQSFAMDYKEAGGIKIPHALEIKFPGFVQEVKFDKVEVNPTIDGAMFEIPEEVKALLPKENEKKDEK